MHRLLIAALLLALSALGALAAAGVTNGGMDGTPVDRSEGKGQFVMPPGWLPVNVDAGRGDRISVEQSDRPGAGQCLHISTSGNDAGVYQTVAPLDKSVTYLVSAWVKRLSGELVMEAYSNGWGPWVMRYVDGTSQGWQHVTAGLTTIDEGAHIYLVAATKADFLIDDVEIHPATIQVGTPEVQPYDLSDGWTYHATLTPATGAAPREVIVTAVPHTPLPQPLTPPQKLTLGAEAAPIEMRLPFPPGDIRFALQVADAATGEVLGASALVPALGSPWDVRFPYKDALYASTGYRWPLRVGIAHTAPETVRSLQATATLFDACGKVLRTIPARPSRDGLLLMVSVPATTPTAATGETPVLPAGRLRLVVKDSAGREVYRQERPLRILPPAPHEVVCAPDGWTMADGKRFFPIGMYWVFANPQDFAPGPKRRDDLFRELRDCGINTLHTYAFEHNDGNDTDENALAYLDTAQELGFKVMMGLRRDWYQGETLNLAAMEARVRKLMGHPALLCWTLWDEPNFDTAFSAPRLSRMYELLNRVDPYHPAMPVFGGPSAGSFRDCTDIFLFDGYPGPGAAGVVTQQMGWARAALPDKPIWFVAQGFRSGGLLPGEEDMQLYWRNAVAGGAKGIFWYSYGGGGTDWDSVRTDPAHWERVKRVMKDLARQCEPGK